MQALSVRFFGRLSLFILVGVAGACGGDPETGDLHGSFQLIRDGAPVDCVSQTAVRKVELSLLDESGVSRRPGYPKEVSCTDGTFEIVGLPTGRHKLELVAYGLVGTAEDERMFQAERVIDFPAEDNLAFILEPEVAFFELAWTFAPDGQLGPCDVEVATIDVFVSSGTSQGAAFSGQFGCRASPQVLNGALAPRMYTVRLDAKSEERFTVYSVTQNRLLSRGENRFDAILEPQGGQLRLDWQFVVGSESPIHSCDDPEVDASEIDIEVTGTTGGDTVTETVACETLRPYALTAARFARGRELVVQLRSEGTHRFFGRTMFTMPEGDLDLPLSSLLAVGDASIGFTITSSSVCAPARVNRYVAELREPGGEPRFVGEASPEENSVSFADVPYGVYDVRLMGFQGEEELCRAQSPRTVGGRENNWTDFEL